MIKREAEGNASGGEEGDEDGLGRGLLRGGWDVRGLGNAGPSNTPV